VTSILLSSFIYHVNFLKGKFEDSKGVISSRKSKNDTIQWPKEKGQKKSKQRSMKFNITGTQKIKEIAT